MRSFLADSEEHTHVLSLTEGHTENIARNQLAWLGQNVIGHFFYKCTL